MLNLFKRKKGDDKDIDELGASKEHDEVSNPISSEEVPAKDGWFTRLRKGLKKSRSHFADGLANLLLGKKQIDDALLEEIETQLLMADVGVQATQQIVTSLTDSLKRKELQDGPALYAALKQHLSQLLQASQAAFKYQKPSSGQPFVLLMVGVNGAGKTTTIGKLAKQFQAQGQSVLLAAGDTFRAAAVEQLQVWGQRNQIPVVAQPTGADSASVIYDAIQSAKAKNIDIVIADTAGRLHTQTNLMDELKKVKRVINKLDEHAPHEVMLILDASIGQNALAQAEQFHQAVGVTGITMTKLDGTAKGGILFAIAKQLNLPFRYIGVGEAIDDLRPFDSEMFIDALFDNELNQE